MNHRSCLRPNQRNHPKQVSQFLANWEDRYLDRIGNWNPQLLREIKGNCTPRNLILVSLVTIAAQLGFWVHWENSAIATAIVPRDTDPVFRLYCTGFRDGDEGVLCEKISASAFAINWSVWWLDLFFWLSAIGLGLLILAGTQFLINNWAREAKQGTLGFIRMTPESSDRILLGKLLGAPALAHWALLLTLPLHTLAGLQGGLGLGVLLLADAAAVTVIATIYLLALFYASTTASSQYGGAGWAFGLLALICYVPIMGLARAPMFLPIPPTSGLQLQWLGQNLVTQPQMLAGITIIAFGSLALALWQSLTRRFDDPASTFSTKAQSYSLTLGFNGLAIGFFVPWASDQFNYWGMVSLPWGLGMMIWMALLLPPRQALLDWARYRHLQKSQAGRSGRSSLNDWLWGDQSPPFLALVVNGAITIALWSLWALVFQYSQTLWVLSILGCSTLLVLFYAALVQWVLLWKVRQPIAWAVGFLGLVTIGPIVLGAALQLQGSGFLRWFWLITPLAPLMPFLTSDPISLGAGGLAFVIDGLAAIAMFFVAMNQLDRLGLSESAALMQGEQLDP